MRLGGEIMVRMSIATRKLGVCRQTIYNWMKIGMPVVYVGRIPYFDMKDVNKWMRSQSEIQKPQE